MEVGISEYEDVLASRVAKKAQLKLFTLVSVVAAIVGYIGINYIQDAKAKVDQAEKDMSTLEESVKRTRDSLNESLIELTLAKTAFDSEAKIQNEALKD